MRSKRAATKDNECTNPIRKEQKDSEFMREEREVIVVEEGKKSLFRKQLKYVLDPIFSQWEQILFYLFDPYKTMVRGG